MSVTPPPGYGVYTRSYLPTGGLHACVNVFGFQNVGNSAANVAQGAVRTALSTNAYNPSLCDINWSWIGDYCLVNIAGVLTSVNSVFSIPGTANFTTPGPGTSVVVTKQTALAGRQYRGRVAYPAGFIQELEISEAGIVLAGTVTSMQNVWNATVAGLITAGKPMVLLHGPPLGGGATPVPTQVSGVTVTALTGSQRRRLRG